MPSSTPVTLPPTAPSTAPPGLPRAAVLHLVQQRLQQLAEARDVGPDPAGPVDDEDRGVLRLVPPREIIRVKPRTCSSEALACRRSSATTARASSRLTSGPGRTSRVAVATARFQSTISAPPMLVMRQPYVVAAPHAVRCRTPTALRPGPTARPAPHGPPPPVVTRPRQRMPQLTRAAASRSRAVLGAGASVVPPQEGEGEEAAVGVDDRAREGVDAGQGAGLGAYEAGGRRAARSGCCRVPVKPATGSPVRTGRSSGWSGSAASARSGGEQGGGDLVVAVEPAAVREPGAGDGQLQLLRAAR